MKVAGRFIAGSTLLMLLLAPFAGMAAESDDLWNMSLEDLLNIEVTTASKKAESIEDAPGIVTVISRQEIDSYGARTLGELMNHVAGAIFLSANVFTDNVVSIRAQSTTPYDNHVLILLDGRPLRDPISGGLNLSTYNTFPMDAVQRVEVIRGPGSVLYGSGAYSGVINVITNMADTDGSSTSLSVYGGSFAGAGQDATVMMAEGDLRVTLGGQHFKNDGPEYDFVDYSGVYNKVNWNRETYGLLGKIDYKRFALTGFVGTFDVYSLDGANNSWDDPAEAQAFGGHETYFMDAGYSHSLGENTDGSFSFTYNRHIWVDTGTTGEVVPTKSYGNSYLGEATIASQPTDKLGVTAGGVMEQSLWSGRLLADGDETTWSLYTQLDYDLLDELTVIIGGQWNKPENVDGNLSPRVGLVSRPTDDLGIKLLYSQAFRKGYPLETSFDNPVFRGNDELEPELINTAEAQMSYQMERGKTALTVYYSEMSNIIVRNFVPQPNLPPIDGYLIYGNGGEHTFYGIELEETYNVMDNLTLQGSFTWQENERDDQTSFALHPNMMFKVGFMYSRPAWSLGVFNAYVSEPTPVKEHSPGIPTPNPRAEAFNLLSAKVNVDLMKLMQRDQATHSLRLFVSATNLLGEDIRYPEYTSRGINTLTPLSNGPEVLAGVTLGF